LRGKFGDVGLDPQDRGAGGSALFEIMVSFD
jgi:hypothetical protein